MTCSRPPIGLPPPSQSSYFRVGLGTEVLSWKVSQAFELNSKPVSNIRRPACLLLEPHVALWMTVRVWWNSLSSWIERATAVHALQHGLPAQLLIAPRPSALHSTVSVFPTTSAFLFRTFRLTGQRCKPRFTLPIKVPSCFQTNQKECFGEPYVIRMAFSTRSFDSRRKLHERLPS
jgi:hypothetical protein